MSRLERSLAGLCGAAMAGIKPASLAVCGGEEAEELYAKRRVFAEKGIRIEPLRTEKDKIVYLVFRENKLREQLTGEENAAFLRRYGYPAGFEERLAFLRLRLQSRCFPHEIGVFLGYPLEDIVGYLNDPKGCIFSGAWKVYADPEKKKRLFEKYRRCSNYIMRRLLAGETLAQIFR